MEFIETVLFTRLIGDYMSDDEYSAFQLHLAELPDAGAIIPGTGGIRKIRHGASGRGKRGGTRIIYYWRTAAGQIFLLTIYAKNEESDLTPQQREAFKKFVETIK